MDIIPYLNDYTHILRSLFFYDFRLVYVAFNMLSTLNSTFCLNYIQKVSSPISIAFCITYNKILFSLILKLKSLLFKYQKLSSILQRLAALLSTIDLIRESDKEVRFFIS